MCDFSVRNQGSHNISELWFQCKESRITQHKWTMIRPKETNKAPITDPQEMEIYELSDKQWTLSFCLFRTVFIPPLVLKDSLCFTSYRILQHTRLPSPSHHLAGYSLRVCKESDTTEQLNNNNHKRKPCSYCIKEHVKNLNSTKTKS